MNLNEVEVLSIGELHQRYKAISYKDRPDAVALYSLCRDMLAALKAQESLAHSAEDDCQRAITRADKLALDLKCLEESTVDIKAYENLEEENERLRETLQFHLG